MHFGCFNVLLNGRGKESRRRGNGKKGVSEGQAGIWAQVLWEGSSDFVVGGSEMVLAVLNGN